MLFVYLIVGILLIGSSDACTEFILRSNDESIVLGRTMDADFKLTPGIYLEPAGMQHQAFIPQSCAPSKGIKWISRHNIIAIRPMEPVLNYVASDGLSAAGLTVAALYFSGYAVYEKISDHRCDHAIPQLQIVSYILGNYDSVAQVRDAIDSNTFPSVWGQKIMGGVVIPGHWSITDKSGDAIVLEYTADGRKVYNNTIRVMTNAPTYDWHMTNVRHYVHLSNKRHPERKQYDAQLNEHVLPSFQASGLLGLPGDYTSPSRFIRAAAMVHYSTVPETYQGAVVQAFHILSSVEVTKGVVEDRTLFMTYTFWGIVKDLAHKCIYYRSYNYISPRKVCLPDGPVMHSVFRMDGEFENAVEDISVKMTRVEL